MVIDKYAEAEQEEISQEDMESAEDELREIFANLDLDDFKTPLDDLEEKLKLRKVTSDELSEVLGVSPSRIHQLWKEGIIEEPVRENGRYYFRLLESVNYYITYLRRSRS